MGDPEPYQFDPSTARGTLSMQAIRLTNERGPLMDFIADHEPLLAHAVSEADAVVAALHAVHENIASPVETDGTW
jgi:hypothetical protein